MSLSFSSVSACQRGPTKANNARVYQRQHAKTTFACECQRTSIANLLTLLNALEDIDIRSGWISTSGASLQVAAQTYEDPFVVSLSNHERHNISGPSTSLLCACRRAHGKGMIAEIEGTQH